MARTKKITEAVGSAIGSAVETVGTIVTEKKVTRKVCTTTVNVEMNGLSVAVADIQNAVKKEVKAAGLSASKIDIYLNTQEKIAYYTVDGDAKEEYKVDLASL